MYDAMFIDRGMDWLQLGCLMVDDTQTDYHKQTLNGLKHPVASNSFFLKLWNEGRYSESDDVEDFLRQDYCGNETIAVVISSRTDLQN